jgi:hypothetical protein
MVALAGLLWNLGDAAAWRDRIEEAIRLLEGEPAGRGSRTPTRSWPPTGSTTAGSRRG